MKLKEINRTSMLSWSPVQHYPIYLASGTSAQQLDTSFSTSASLEFFELNLADPSLDMKLCGKLSTSQRYHKLVWSPFGIDAQSLPSGVLIAGGENGKIILYDPAKIVSGDDSVVIAESDRHSGPVRALDINPFQTNLVASGGNESEIYIWDLNNFGSPMTPGPKTQPLEDISSVAWNKQVQHILASCSPSGRTSVWDLRKNDLIIKVSDHSNRMHCSGMAWHPEVATQLVVASEDDRMPVIQMWDLRFASSPLKIFEKHTRGILAIAWSSADPDLLLSCGKDGRILCWNPNTAEVLYELPTGNQWCFDIQWCSRNPAVFSASGFDGYVNIYSIMGGTSPPQSQRHVDQISSSFSSIDPFGTGQTLPPLELPKPAPLPSTVNPLKKPPRWIRTPAGASFAFGGKLVSLENRNPEQSMPVHVSQVVTETDFLKRSNQLQATLHSGQFVDFCQEKIDLTGNEFERTVWSFLKANFDSDSRTRFLELLGYNKEELDLKISVALTEETAEVDPTPVADTSLFSAADTPEAVFDLISAAGLQPTTTQELAFAPSVETRDTQVSGDTPGAAFDLSVSENLHTAAGMAIDSVPPVKSEDRLEVNDLAASFQTDADEKGGQQHECFTNDHQWDEEEIILEEPTAPVHDILAPIEDVLLQDPSVEVGQGPSEETLHHPTIEVCQDHSVVMLQGEVGQTHLEPFQYGGTDAPPEEPLQDFGVEALPEEILKDPSIEAPPEDALQDPRVEAPPEDTLQDPSIKAPPEELSQDPSLEAPAVDAFSDLSLEAQSEETFQNSSVEAPNNDALQVPNVEALPDESLQNLSIEALPEETLQGQSVEASPEIVLQDPSVEAPPGETLQGQSVEVPPEIVLQDPRIEAPPEETLHGQSVEVPPEIVLQDPSIEAPPEETLQGQSVEAPPEIALQNCSVEALPQETFPDQRVELVQVIEPMVNGKEVLKDSKNNTSQVTATQENGSLCINQDVDGLITQALLTGDFEGAVELCLHDNRMADAMILAIAGGTELLKKTQQRYFQKSQSKLNKLLSAVVMKDLRDIVGTCELQNWKEALAAVMTYAQPQEFFPLCDSLGDRLEAANDAQLQAQACICYICAGNVEKLVSCWTKAQDSNNPLVLQDLVEKVVVMQHAVEKTQNGDPTSTGVLLAKNMSAYANLLASQGCLSTAINYLPDKTNEKLRERLIKALGQQDTPIHTVSPREPSATLQPNNPNSAPQPHTAPSAHLQYYQPVRAASTVTSWSNQTPTALPHVPTPLSSGTTTDQSKMEPPKPVYGMPVSGSTVPSTAPVMFSHQYQTYPQNNHSQPEARGLTGYQSHRYSSVAPPLAEPTAPPQPPGFLSQYSNPAPPLSSYSSVLQSSQCPSYSSPSNPALFSETSTSPLCPIPPSSMASVQHSGPGSPGFYMQPPPLSGVSGPQNGWNDPPTVIRAPKKKQVPGNYTPPAPITAPIMAPLGVDPHISSGPPQFVSQIPQALQAPYSSAQLQQQQPHAPQAINSLNAAVPKTSPEGPPGAPTGDTIQPMKSVPSEKITKKPIPNEHVVLKTTFEGLIQKCLTAANDPQTKRKLDDANKRLEALYDKLREQTLSPAIVGGLHNIARSIDSRSYTEGLNLHTHIVRSSNFSEISGFMPVLKVVLTQANRLGV